MAPAAVEGAAARRRHVPRESTVSTRPSISKPSHAEWSMFMWCVVDRDATCGRSGRRRRCRRRRPAGSRPCAPYRPNMRAGVVQRELDPARRARSGRRRRPGRAGPCGARRQPIPFGILEKSPSPSSFCSLKQNGQWSVRDHRQVAGAQVAPQLVLVALGRERSGVEHTHFAPSNPGCRRGAPRARGRGTAGRSRRRRSGPRRAPGRACSTACFADMCTTYSGAPVRCAEHDRAVRGLLLDLPRPGERVVVRGGLARARAACATRTSMAVPFSACIMIVEPLRAAVCIARRIWPSSTEEHARVGHEQLEAR